MLEPSMSQDGLWITSVLVILAVVVTSWLVSIIKYRHSYSKLHGSLKAPPFSMWFGTIPATASMFKHCPKDTHPMATMTLLHRKHNLGPLYFLDNWPIISPRQLVINDPALAAQVTQQSSLPKSPLYPKFIGHITGKTSMVFTEGAQWKQARALFNPGFAINHLMTLVPCIVDDTQIFCKILALLSDSQKVTPIDDLLVNLTIDIMGHIILDHDLKSQTTENELVKAFRSAVYWTPNSKLTHPIFRLNFVQAFAHWYNARRMDRYIRKVIHERLARSTRNGESRTKSSRRPIIDLAIDTYFKPDCSGEKTAAAPIIDGEFDRIAIDQMRTFIFGGHDTSSSTLCFIYHLLNLHPEALAKVRKEHDNVFGPSSSTAEAIKENPNLLYDLPYTTAVIKEILRLFPPVSGSRDGSSQFSLNLDGVKYPTKDTTVWINIHTIHRRADLWPQPDDFIPERFLPPPHNFQEVPKDAWRPFQKGPRACIGQELAMLDMKIIMVMTLRDFDIKAEYEEWDRALGREKPGETLDGRRGMFGYRAYQQLKATAKPADGMPVRVTRRQNAGS